MTGAAGGTGGYEGPAGGTGGYEGPGGGTGGYEGLVIARTGSGFFTASVFAWLPLPQMLDSCDSRA